MSNIPNQIPGSENFRTEIDNFRIPQETYNKMLYEILGVQKIVKETILSLLTIEGKEKQDINAFCEENGYTENDLLERSRVGLRMEINNEKKILLRNGKQNLLGIQGKTDDEIIQLMKNTLDGKIKKYHSNTKVFWPDGSINYVSTMKNIEKIDDNKSAYAESVEELKLQSKKKGELIASTLLESDFKLLDTFVNEALKNSNKLSSGNDGNTVGKFLKIQFPEIPKLYSKKAQEYFYKKYIPLYKEKYSEKLKEIYPHDRKIVIIPLAIKGKSFCKVRGEMEIIDIVTKKIDEWKIDMLSHIDTHVNQKKVEMLIQKMINIYYEILHNISIYNYNENNYWRIMPLDLEKIGSTYKEKNNAEVVTLAPEEFIQKLLENAIFEIERKKNNNSRTGNMYQLDHSKIPRFGGFKSVLDHYKDYFLNFLEENDPNKRIRKPGILKILTDMGFTFSDSEKTPIRKKVTIIKNNKKAS